MSNFPSMTVTNIPTALAELEVVSVIRYQSGFDLKFRFEFADGDHLIYKLPDDARTPTGLMVVDIFHNMVEKVREYHSIHPGISHE